MEGILPSGKPLKGKRANSVEVQGIAAACETCHRRSGMGSLEGNIVVPPITGRFLFANENNRPIALVDPRAPKNVSRAHNTYTQSSLAKAIRKGINVGNRPLSPLMPHYDLSNAEIKALMVYLRQLSAELSPGVGEDTLHFATVVTPDVDPKKQEAMLGMMQKAFTQRNASQEDYSGRMRMPIDLIPRTLRNWQLTVWKLKGAPDTWAGQLAEKYRKEPVFAVISGLSNTTWQPVHFFCQQEKIPCMLPSTTLPATETAFYSLYYSRGVALEGDVLAKYLRDQGKNAPHRIVQVYRDDEVGRGAAKALTEALHDSGIQVESRVLSGQDESALNVAMKDIANEDGLMLWLRPADLSAVGKIMPILPATRTFASGFLAEENYASMPKAWQPQIKIVYPYELGEKRQKNIVALKKWLQSWSLPLVDETFQSVYSFDVEPCFFASTD